MINKISVSHLIWYLVPGLCFLALLIIPLAAFAPGQLKIFIQTITPIGLLVVGVLCGFALDGLRIYRLRNGYDSIKKEFFKTLVDALELDGKYDPYFVLSTVNDFAAKDKNSNIGLHHAIWIMHGTIAMLSLAFSCLWGVIYVYIYFISGAKEVWFFGVCSDVRHAAFLCFIFTLAFYFAYVRIKNISIEDQRMTNNLFVGYARSNKNDLRKLILENGSSDGAGNGL